MQFLTACPSTDHLSAWDYCYEDSPSNVLPGLKNIGQEGCNNGSCNACEGDCDTDADCAGSLKCFERDNQDGIPGCSDVGDGYAGEYFEVLATEGHDGMVPSS